MVIFDCRLSITALSSQTPGNFNRTFKHPNVYFCTSEYATLSLYINASETLNQTMLLHYRRLLRQIRQVVAVIASKSPGISTNQ
jgi:isoprenylcysteine carboxyl methyltransferase (ICMT) family protein YpbQ